MMNGFCIAAFMALTDASGPEYRSKNRGLVPCIPNQLLKNDVRVYRRAPLWALQRIAIALYRDRIAQGVETNCRRLPALQQVTDQVIAPGAQDGVKTCLGLI
mgnify:CR=1 FL=1